MRLLAQRLAVLLASLLPVAAAATSPETIRERGLLRCGLSGERPGFAEVGSAGLKGFDVELCRAFAAALLETGAASTLVLPSAANGPARLLEEGRADLIVRAQPSGSGARLAAVVLLEGVGWLYRPELPLGPLAALTGRTACVREAESAAAARRAPTLVLEQYPSLEEAGAAFLEGRCDLLLGELPALAVWRRDRASAAAFKFGETLLTLRQTGPLVPPGAEALEEALRLVIAMLFEAEALGVTQAMAVGRAPLPADPRAARLLEEEIATGALPAHWVRRVLTHVGHYGEIYERTLGSGSRLALPRGVNLPPDKGGLLRPLPLR